MGTILRRSARFSIAVAMAIPSVSALAESDLKEADARGAALDFMSAAEERFDCKLEKHSMNELGHDENTLFLFRLELEGGECDEAMLFLTNLAAREEKIIFRSIDNVGSSDDEPNLTGEPILNYELRMPFDQALIHEVNPELDED